MPHMKWWTGQSLIVQRFMATTATVPPQRLSDVEWSKRVRTRQVEVVICGGADSDMTWHGVSQNGKPRLPPFHSRVWRTSPILEMLCHYVMIVMAVDGGVSQWYSLPFSLSQLAKILEDVMPPAGQLTFWSSLTSSHSWSLASASQASQTRRIVCRPSWS